MQALEALGLPVDQWDAILVYWLLEKLDAESRKQFELAHPGTDVLTFKELTTFMDRRSRALESSGDQHEASVPKTTPKKVLQEAYSSTVEHSASCQMKNAMGLTQFRSVIATSSWAHVRERQWWGSSNCAWIVWGGISWLIVHRNSAAALATGGIIHHCTLSVQSSSKVVWRVVQHSVVQLCFCQQQWLA